MWHTPRAGAAFGVDTPHPYTGYSRLSRGLEPRRDAGSPRCRGEQPSANPTGPRGPSGFSCARAPRQRHRMNVAATLRQAVAGAALAMALGLLLLGSPSSPLVSAAASDW